MPKNQQQTCVNGHPATSAGYCSVNSCTFSASGRHQAVGGVNQYSNFTPPVRAARSCTMLTEDTEDDE